MFREAVISSGRAGIGETPIFAEGSIREPLWNDRCWRKAVVRRANDHAGSESLVEIAVVPEGEGAGLSA